MKAFRWAHEDGDDMKGCLPRCQDARTYMYPITLTPFVLRQSVTLMGCDIKKLQIEDMCLLSSECDTDRVVTIGGLTTTGCSCSCVQAYTC